MFRHVDKLQAELPAPKNADPNAATCQELLGGDYSRMSTLNSSMDQSFDCCSTSKPRPFYNPAASITAKEPGHAELVANVIAVLANGPDKSANDRGGADLSDAPFADMSDVRLAASFLSNGGGTRPMTDRRTLELVDGLPGAATSG